MHRLVPIAGLLAALLQHLPAQAAPVTYSNQGSRNIPTLSFGSRHLFVDLDADGDLDILYQTGNTAGTGIEVRLNTGGSYGAAIAATAGTGAFTSGPLNGISFTQIGIPNLAVVDLDNDGDPDMVEFLNSTAPRWIRNNGNGSFTASTVGSLPTLTFGARQLFMDLDADGDPDILYQNGSTAGTGIAVQLNNGNGTFGAAINATSGSGTFTSGPLAGVSFSQITTPNDRVVDVDDDGDTDIVEFLNATAPRWIQNNGNGSFTVTSIGSLPTLAFGTRHVFFDIDADGDQDILYQTGNTSGTGIAMQLNNGNGTFAGAVAATSGTGTFTSGPLAGISFAQIVSGNTDIADYDTDGDPDVFDFTNSTAPLAIRQDGTRPLISSTSPADNATGVALNANIVLTFDRSVVKGNGNLYLVNTATSAVVETVPIGSGNVTGSGATWTYNPSITLTANTGYALRSDDETFIDADGRAFYGIFNNTTYNFTTGTTSLPVKLETFAGSAERSGNLLAWKTGAESPGTHFVVERSEDGLRFTGIAEVSGRGGNARYSTTDAKPPVTGYYRLRMVEQSGEACYSWTVVLQRPAPAALLRLSPVPAESSLLIEAPGELSGLTAVVTDGAGRTVCAVILANAVRLDIGAWPAGAYQLRLPDGNGRRFVKR